MVLKNTDLQIITAVKELFHSASQNIVVVPHENPDGDAIGSALGISEVLSAVGHRVTVVSPTDYPGFLKWFSSEVPVLVAGKNKKEVKKAFGEAGLLVCVDFNEVKRAGMLTKKIKEFTKTKILIDHHPYPTDFCTYTISEVEYSSTAELIYDVAVATGLEKAINFAAAEALYTGILTDTGSFSHNTTKNAFRVVSELLEYDIDTAKIQASVYHNFSAARMKLLGYCLNEKMIVYPELRTAMIAISKKELDDFDFKSGDTEGFVNYPLSIDGIVFSAFFMEKEGLVKASFRSKGDFPANLFSKENFGGGGHLNAAGGESKLTFDETIEKFTQLLPAYRNQLLKTII